MKFRHIAAVLFIAVLSQVLLQQGSLAQEKAEGKYEQGRELAFKKSKGNCLACHMLDNGELPGNSGPPLVQMALRFPDRDILRSQIWDASKINPATVMPPFGKHNILTEDEIDLVVDYLLSL